MDVREMLLSPFAYMPPPGILEGIPAAVAAAPVAGSTHTIVEIVAHLDFWQTWFLDRCRGTATPMADTASKGWPAAAEADWDARRDSFLRGVETAAALGAEPSDLAKPVTPAIEFPPLAHHTVGDVLTHLAIHNAHHLGQVVTLRQMLGVWPPPGGSFTW